LTEILKCLHFIYFYLLSQCTVVTSVVAEWVKPFLLCSGLSMVAWLELVIMIFGPLVKSWYGILALFVAFSRSWQRALVALYLLGCLTLMLDEKATDMVNCIKLLVEVLERNSIIRDFRPVSQGDLSYGFQVEDSGKRVILTFSYIARVLERFSRSAEALKSFASVKDFIDGSLSQMVLLVVASVWSCRQTLCFLIKWLGIIIYRVSKMVVLGSYRKVTTLVSNTLTCIFYPFVIVWRFVAMVKERLAMEGKMAKVSPPPQPVQIDMDTRLDKLEAMFKSVVRGETQESSIPGSVMFKVDKWPEHLVGIKNRDGVHIGFGFFLVHAGNWVLMSAKHVIKDINMGSIYNGGKRAIKIENKRIYCAFELDFAGIIMENNDAALMGVKKVKLDTTRSAGTSLSLYGMYRNQLVVSRGNLEGNTEVALKFKHSCSSQPGFCGSPLITGDNKVIGIHISTDNVQYNYAVSLDLLVETLETDTVTTEKSMYNNDEDLELSGRNRRFMIYDNESGEYVEYGVKLSKKAWRASLQDKVQEYRSTAAYGSWADDNGNELPDIDAWKNGIRESGLTLENSFMGFPERRKTPKTKVEVPAMEAKTEVETLTSPQLLTSATPDITNGTMTSDKRKETKRAKRRAQRQRKKLAKVTLPLLVDSGAVPKEVKESITSPPTLNSETSPASKTGDGPIEEVKQLGSPLPTTPVATKQVVNPVGKRSVKSSMPSPKTVNILKLARLAGVWKEKLGGDLDVDPLLKHLETQNQLGMPVTPRLTALVWDITTKHCAKLDLETMKETCSLYFFLSQ
jgi:hypothetical protein